MESKDVHVIDLFFDKKLQSIEEAIYYVIYLGFENFYELWQKNSQEWFQGLEKFLGLYINDRDVKESLQNIENIIQNTQDPQTRLYLLEHKKRQSEQINNLRNEFVNLVNIIRQKVNNRIGTIQFKDKKIVIPNKQVIFVTLDDVESQMSNFLQKNKSTTPILFETYLNFLLNGLGNFIETLKKSKLNITPEIIQKLEEQYVTIHLLQQQMKQSKDIEKKQKLSDAIQQYIFSNRKLRDFT